MQTIHPTDHLNILNHVATVLKGHPTLNTTLSGTVPSGVQTTHYDPTGKTVASQSTTNYSGVKIGSTGNIIGGALKHATTDTKGKAIDGSTINFNGDGIPSGITTAINNRFTTGIFKQISLDLSQLSWVGQSRVQAGQIKIKNTDHNQTLRSEGTISFANEKIASGSFTHYGPNATMQPTGQTEIDYSNTKFIGSRLVGGHVAIVSKDVTGTVKSQSNMFMSNLGRVLQIHTSNYDQKTNSVKNNVIADFAKMQFTPRNKLFAGNIAYNITDTAGNLLSTSQVIFANEIPVSSTTLIYKLKKLVSKVITDFSGAAFNNQLKVICSDIESKTYNGAGQLIARTVTTFDEFGNSIKKMISNLNPKTGNLINEITKDLSNAIFDHKNNVIAGEVSTITNDLENNKTIESVKKIIPKIGSIASGHSSEVNTIGPVPPDSSIHCSSSQVKDANGNLSEVTQTCTRSDGSLFKTVVTKAGNSDGSLSKKISFTDKKKGAGASTVSLYGIDGKTLIKTYKIDLSGISVENGKVSGAASLNSFFTGKTLESKSKLSY